MGPRQNAADAFIVASCDVGLHDRWIPDEDWVRVIRDTLENKDCTLHDMNMGLSSKLTFENNRATVNERTVVLHNNKKVQTGKGGQKRNVHFYYVYVLDANQPVPLVATRQDFYQAIWDAPERSNRSLKWTAPSAPAIKNKVATPPTKRARAVSPQSAPVPQSPPDSSEAATRMLQYSWNVVFPSLRFPSEMIVLQLQPPPQPKIGVRDIQLGNGVVIHDVPTKYEFVVDSDLATGLKLPAKIQLLKQDMEEKEEHAGGEYDIDIDKYFKLVSSRVDQSIFED
jgi:hypothetical protein